MMRMRAPSARGVAMRAMFAALAFALAACGQTTAVTAQPEQPPAEESAATTVPPHMTTREMLMDCAGAIAAAGDVDPMVEPQADTPAINNLWTVLALMDKEPGLEGMEGRRQAVASAARWEGRTQAEAQARADECMAHFSGSN